MTEDFPMDKRASDVFDCDPNFYTLMKAKPLLDRLEWAAFKMCHRGHHEDFASDVMTEAKAHIMALETALRQFADEKNWEEWVGWVGDGEPQDIARAALAGEKKDG